MLSPNFSSPNISFNLSHSPSSLPLFVELQTLRNSSTSKKLNTHHFLRCSSCPNPSSSYKVRSSEYSYTSSEESVSENDNSLNLSPNLLARWLRSSRSFRDVKRIQSIVIRGLRDENTYLYNNLINVFIKFGNLNYARNVFDEMSHRNVVTWTVIINGYLSFGQDEEALRVFQECVENGIQPNETMFVCVLKLCCKRNDLELGRQVHATIAKTGRRNLIVDSAIVKLYAQCRDLTSAFRAFDKTPNKDVVSWTTMVTACAQQQRGNEAFSLFSQILGQGFSPNEFTLCSVLKACSDKNTLSFGKQLHCAVIKKVYKSDVFVGTSLVHMYAKCGEISHSRSYFDAMRHRNTATWTAIISGYAREGQGDEALFLFREMTNRKVSANNLTVVSVVRACGAIKASMAGRELHAQIVKSSKIDSCSHLGNTLVWFYCRCGEYVTAARVLQRTPLRDVVSWTALISGCAGLGMETEALEFLKEMIEDGVEPNSFTFSSALKACAKLEAGLHGRLIHSSANKAPLAAANVFVGSALIHMYARCGRVKDASKVFDGMPERNLVAWKSMIVGYARNGLCREALRLMYRMQAEGFAVDDYVRTTVLNSCGGGYGDGDGELSGECKSECELQFG